MKHGHDPTVVLGANWDFFYVPAEVRREEFYHPSRSDDLARCLAPYHPVASVWHRAAGGDPGNRQISEAIRRGALPIVAVDNYFLPFRPAYLDVHAAHTVVAYGFDEETEEVYVIDSMPPAFDGPMRSVDLEASRHSANPSDGGDAFFTGSPIAARWLEVSLTGPFPPFTMDWLTEVIEANLERFATPAQGPAFSGMSGLARYLSGLPGRAAGPEGARALQEAYVVGWAIQAGTAMHADFLASAGRRFGSLGLLEAGRLVERVAHDWTGIRMTAAHGLGRPDVAALLLERRARGLVRNQEEALEAIDWTIHGRGARRRSQLEGAEVERVSGVSVP